MEKPIFMQTGGYEGAYWILKTKTYVNYKNYNCQILKSNDLINMYRLEKKL